MATQTTHKQPSELKRLSFLIGKWHTEGTITSASDTTVIRGMDTYEWISGGCFILHCVDVFIGNERTEAVEIIGYDEACERYFMTSYDNAGSVMTMDAVLENTGLLKLGNKEMRAALYRNEDGNMTAKWELFKDIWLPWMEIKLRK